MSRSILHVAQPTDGGVAVVAAQLAAHQIGLGWKVMVACPGFAAPSERGDGAGGIGARSGAREPSRLAVAARATGATVLDWEATRSPGRSAFDEAGRLRALVRELAPDLVHLHSSKAGLAGRLALRGALPTVFQPHAWSFEAVSGATRAAAVRWERWATRWTDVTVCVSAQEQRDGERAGVRGRYAVVPNGVDPAHFVPGSREQARIRLGLPADGPLALTLGRLCPQKGQDLLLEVWPAVLDRVPGARLALVGDGPDRDKLTALIRSRPRLADSVSLAGGTDDSRSWYQACDLLVLPSRWEGMALVPLEAMACGRPVVGFEVAGIRQCLPPWWADRALAAPGDGAALARLVGRAMEEIAAAGKAETVVVPAGSDGSSENDTSSESSAGSNSGAIGDTLGEQTRTWVVNRHSIAQTVDLISNCYNHRLGD